MLSDATRRLRRLEAHDAAATSDPSPRHLMVSGSIRLTGVDEPAQVCRAMAILDRDGCPIGRVAGILVDAAAQGIAILLGEYSARPVYRWVDPELIASVDEMLRLRIGGAEIDRLPPYQAIWRAPGTPPIDNERPLP